MPTHKIYSDIPFEWAFVKGDTVWFKLDDFLESKQGIVIDYDDKASRQFMYEDGRRNKFAPIKVKDTFYIILSDGEKYIVQDHYCRVENKGFDGISKYFDPHKEEKTQKKIEEINHLLSKPFCDEVSFEDIIDTIYSFVAINQHIIKIKGNISRKTITKLKKYFPKISFVGTVNVDTLTIETIINIPKYG